VPKVLKRPVGLQVSFRNDLDGRYILISRDCDYNMICRYKDDLKTAVQAPEMAFGHTNNVQECAW
jgi:hypothetical protein